MPFTTQPPSASAISRDQAFSVGEHDLEQAMVALKEHGVAVRGPVHHEWMQATCVYFPDPDGHDLELCAPVGPVPGSRRKERRQ